MPLKKLGNFFGASDELKALTARTRRLRELQTLYFGSAPRELASTSRVKSYRTGTLVISADNAAVAAKLRQLAPTLLASIRKTEDEITSLRIEVQVSGAARERAPEGRKNALGADAVSEFAELSKRLGEGPLKTALKRLVRHHSRGR